LHHRAKDLTQRNNLQSVAENHHVHTSSWAIRMPSFTSENTVGSTK
jgi:hypothetical protein